MSQAEDMLQKDSAGRGAVAGGRDFTAWFGVGGLVLAVAVSAALLVNSEDAGLRTVSLAVALVLLAFLVAADTLRTRTTARGAAEAERALATALSVSADGMAVSDKAGRLLTVNAAFRALFPVSGAPAIDRLLVPEPDSAEPLYRLFRAMREGEVAEAEVTLARDGGTARVDLAVGPLPGGTGRALWRITLRPDTAAPQAEAAPGDLDHLPVGAFTADLQGQVMALNARLADWTGRAAAACTDGLRLTDLFPTLAEETPETWDTVVVRDTVLPGGEDAGGSMAGRPVRLLLHLERESGEVPGRILALVLPGEVLGGTGTGAEESGDGHLVRFLNQTPIGIVVAEPDGAVIEWNRGFVRLTGEGETRRLTDALAPEDVAEVALRLRDAWEGKRFDAPAEVRFPRTGRVAQLYASRIEEADVTGVIVYLIDTTEQKSLELQFAQSQKMQAVGQLAGGIAHDFNNLLTAIIGFCDLLLVRHEPGDPSFGDVMQIKQNANRAANLVRQLLAFSRQQTLRPKVLQLTDTLADLSNLLSRLIGGTIHLKMIHGRDLGLVKVDQGQFEQVVINLAVNARDAMPEGGTLTIATRNVSADEVRVLGHPLMPPADYVCISVTDTGTGIPKENLGKIFEPFFTTKEVGKGTGLGLSTVYGIIKQTGGFVFPVSEVGKGTTFDIYLPRHEEEQKAAPAAEEAPPARQDLTGRGTILLVEDETAVRSFAVRALTTRGYHVLEADGGEAALEIVQEHPGRIDLLISDVVMPTMDGPTLVAAARKSRPDMRIIFISGYAEDAFRKSLKKDENFTFLPKPFSLKQLAATVKDVLNA
ncbi:response regulator [Futiania mangrovi]|uniref:histidine kinase n=1 Tax=Futiania mangrovi TaxID=2959716 RepID=A0A9J6P9Q2_9PROT|nr:response regulator [Futiania mangrovii]MCP1335041.1 response regulator [Futiania mangrovii]